MRRADRLFRITEYLKARKRPVTAQELADLLEVSVRTIYRDMMDLTLSGVPILGEAGVGYMLDKDYMVRPLMFDVGELDALMLGARMVQSWSDPQLAKMAGAAMDKISAILPTELQEAMMDSALFSPVGQRREKITIDFNAVRKAIRTQNKVDFHYERLNGEQSTRVIRPLGLAFFGPVWLLLGWCEKRDDFRNFRLDRISKLTVLEEKFRHERGKRLVDYEACMLAEYNQKDS